MLISGLSKLTLLDFPEHIACTVFTGGCNFRCPFCHNAGLVLTPADNPQISEIEFFDFLQKRKGKLEGVCITGGEPTLQKDLPGFIGKIREMGFKIKLDTNGYEPEILQALLSEGLLDMVAMDLKNSNEKMAETAGISNDKFDISRIKKSIQLLKGSNISHEFRTTVIRELHTASDLEHIALEIYDDPSPYFLQSYKDTDEILCKKAGHDAHFTAYTDIELRKLLSAAKRVHPNTHIRGEED